MPRGFAHPYLLIAVLVIAGAGTALLAGSKNISGLVLGTGSKKENIYQDKAGSLKVTIVSPKSSWDLVQYLCITREECEKSQTSGKWWATVSGAPTSLEGYTAYIDKPETSGYRVLKVQVKAAGIGSTYLHTGEKDTFMLVNLSDIGKDGNSPTFR